MASAPSATQPFSLHTRGVTAYESTQYFDLQHQLGGLRNELRDISSSAVLFIYLQGWQSVSVTIITIASVSFFNYVGQSGVSAALSWTPIALLVFLPLVVLAYLAVQRRDAAHRELAAIKTLAVQIFWSYEDSPSHRLIVQDLLLSLLGILKDYLNARRFYSESYPFGGITERMTTIAKTRAKQMQQTGLLFRNLSRCPEDTAHGRRQADLVLQLQQAFERVALLKEYGLPQSLRTLARLYVVLVVPIFYGPYYAEVTNGVQSFVFVLFFAIMVHLAMAALLNASMIMEDPFATDSLDGVYCDEILFDAEKVLSSDSFLVRRDGNGLHEEPPPELPPPSTGSPAAIGRPGEMELNIAPPIAPIPPIPSREMAAAGRDLAPGD